MADVPETQPPDPAAQRPSTMDRLAQRARWRRPKPSSEELQDRRIKNWAELWATVILSLATLVTAWAGYEAGRWNSVQTALNLQATGVRIDAGRLSIKAQQLLLLDVGLFADWANATGSGNRQLADFYQARFRDEFATAFGAWLATRPLEGDDGPASPFEMPEYRLAVVDEEAATMEKAEEVTLQAEIAGNFADRYTLLIVILAGSLLLAGLAHRFEWAELRGLVVGVALLVLVYCLVAIIRLPVV